MGYKFMSDEWFAKVEELTEEVNPEIPAAAADLKLNIAVTDDEGEKELSIAGGKMGKGDIEDATVKITLPMDLARSRLGSDESLLDEAACLCAGDETQGSLLQLWRPESVG